MRGRAVWRRRVAGVAVVALVIAVAVSCIRPGTIDTVAGHARRDPGCAAQAVAVEACVGAMHGATADPAGNVYFVELLDADYNYRVRKLTPAGTLSTIAGGGTSEAEGAVATNARLRALSSPLLRASEGTLFVFSRQGSETVVRRITPGGAVWTVAAIDQFETLAIDGANNLYASWRCTVIKYAASFYVKSVIAGTTDDCKSSGDNGPAKSARLFHPHQIAADPAGNIFLSESSGDYATGEIIRKIDLTGTISRVAGNGQGRGDVGDGGPAVSAQLSDVQAMIPDGAGGLIVGLADVAPNGRALVRRVDNAGIITRFAGNLDASSTTDGVLATQSAATADALVRTAAGVYIFDNSGGNARVLRVAPSGVVTTVLGKPDFYGDGGPATAAGFNQPSGLVYDPAGNLFVADTRNNRIRKVTPDGIVHTVAGTSLDGFSGDGGPATSARLTLPVGLALDPAGNLYIADAGNRRIRKIDVAGTISTVAGNGNPATEHPNQNGDGGPATAAQLTWPIAVAVRDGDLFIGDTGWTHEGVRRVRRATISTVTARDVQAEALTVDASGRLLMAGVGNVDRSRNHISAIEPNGQITTIFEPHGAAEPLHPSAATVGVAADGAGRIYATGAVSVSELNAKGELTIPVGSGKTPVEGGFAGDGGPGTEALLDSPTALAVSPDGKLAIADTGNNRVRVMSWSKP